MIASLIYARRFEYGDPDFIKMLKILKENMGENTGLFPEVLNTFPILLHIPGLADKVFPGKKTFLTIMDKLVTEHKKIWDLYQPSCDLTGAFLAEMEKMRLWDLVSIVL